MDVFQLFGSIDVDVTKYQSAMAIAYADAYNLWSILNVINNTPINPGGGGYGTGLSTSTGGISSIVTNIQMQMNNLQAIQNNLNATQNNVNTQNTINNIQKTAKAAQTAGTQIQQGAQKASQGWTVWKGIMSNLGTMAINKGYNFGKSFLQAGYEYNTTVETEIAHFTTLLQTTKEDATAFFKELEQFAIDTPLSLTGATETAASMLGTGIEREELINTMHILGDLAMGDTEKMKGLAKALTDVKTYGSLLAQDARQCTNRGVPLYEMLLDYYKANYVIHRDENGSPHWYRRSLIPELVKDGKGYDEVEMYDVKKRQATPGLEITYDVVLEVLKSATSEGGMFYKAMDAAMETTEGQTERLQDNYARTAGSVMKTVNAIFMSDTIPALNETLQRLEKWARENPDAIKNLAQAFSDLATKGIDVAVTSLTTLMDYWSENRKEFDAMLVMLGGLAMATGHPLAGLAMITVGGYDVWSATENEVKETLTGNENKTSVASLLMPDDIEAKLRSGQTIEQLSEEEQQAYERANMFYRILSVVDAFASGVTTDKFMPHTGDMSDYFASVMTEEKWANMPPEMQEWYLETLADMNNKGGGKRFGVDPAATSFDPSLFTFDGGAGTEDNPFSFGGESETEDNPFSFGGALGGRVQLRNDQPGSMGMQLVLAAFQQLPSQLKTEVAAAAQEGVANGVSGMTITGHITTGDVKLQDGTIVGSLMPQINMQLGWQDKLSSRG